MPTYVALLRAINLGARNKISMGELGEVFAALGARDVTTHLRSGNVVFGSHGRTPEALRKAIEKEIERRMGLEITVLIRTAPQLAGVVARNPFLVDGRDPAKLHVTFLATKPAAGRARDLQSLDSGSDEIRIAGREVYLHLPGGYGRSKLSNALFEKQLGVAATTRNWNTVTTLSELAASPPRARDR